MKRYDSSLASCSYSDDINAFFKLFDFLISCTEKIHKAGIIHRDIKPENILLDNGNYVLADFGIASYNPEIFEIKADTDKKERIGNRLFSAPEQENKGIEAHPTMDIYAIGQVLQWYMTSSTHRGTGRKKISTFSEYLQNHDKVIEKCLQQNPINRFQTIVELKDFLRQTSEKRPSDYLRLFHDACRKSFPRNDRGIAHSNSKDRIDSFFCKLKEKEENYENRLWWSDGDSSDEVELTQKKNGVWKLKDFEYNITDIWVHFEASLFNDFVLFRYQKGEPFEFEGNQKFAAAIVNGAHLISDSEYYNRFAEIEGEILDLSQHQTEYIFRSEKDGYLFIGTQFHCILHEQNEKRIADLIKNLIKEDRTPEINELLSFQYEIRKFMHDVIRSGYY
jgi:eukaryotic-like serine/threonine-protein kinase